MPLLLSSFNFQIPSPLSCMLMYVLCCRVVVFSVAVVRLGNKSFYSFHIMNAWNIPGKGSASGPEKIQLISCDFKDVDMTFQGKPKSHGERLGQPRLYYLIEIERILYST